MYRQRQLWIAEAIAGGIALAGMIGGAITDRRARKAQKAAYDRDRQREDEVYARQRADALKDQEALNRYNAPVEQMNRLRQAGINPYLYGSGAESTGAMVRGVEMTKQESEPLKFNDRFTANAAQGVEMFMNMRMAKEEIETKNAQQNNLDQSTINMQKESLIKDMTLEKMLVETNSKKFKLTQDQRIADLLYRKRQLDNAAMEANTIFTTDANKRANELQPWNVKETKARIGSIKKGTELTTAQIKKTVKESFLSDLQVGVTGLQKEKIQSEIALLNSERVVKRVQAALAAEGIYPGDPWYVREFKEKLHEMADYLPEDKY